MGLATHVADIVNLIRWEDLEQVVLVGHSYGGVVVSQVAEAIPNAIASAVFLDAFVPEDGRSLLDYIPDATRREALRAAAGRSENNSVPPLPAADFGVAERDQAWVDAKSTPHPFATFTDPVNLTGARERVAKKAYIRASKHASPVFQAFYEARRQDPAWQTLVLDAGHDAMFDAPDEFAELLRQLA